jgi:hypothetical protein
VPRREKRPAKGRDPRRNARRESAAEEPRRRRGRPLAGEANLPKYTPDIALRSIDGHLTRPAPRSWLGTGWRRRPGASAATRSARCSSARSPRSSVSCRALAAHPVTTRPYPVHMWAESFDNNAPRPAARRARAPGLGRLPRGRAAPPHGLVDVGQGGLPRHRGVRAQHARPLGGEGGARAGQGRARAVRAELSALASEVGHLDELVAGSGLDAVPATGDDVAWLMHRSCSLGLPAPRTIAATEQLPLGDRRPRSVHRRRRHVPGAYAPTVRVVGRLRSSTVQRNVAVLTVGSWRACASPRSTTRGCSTATGCRSRWSGRRGSTCAGPRR